MHFRTSVVYEATLTYSSFMCANNTNRTFNVPAYLHRQGFVPRSQDDFGDGGAFPEVHIAQYPLHMGEPGKVHRISPPPCSLLLHPLTHAHVGMHRHRKLWLLWVLALMEVWTILPLSSRTVASKRSTHHSQTLWRSVLMRCVLQDNREPLLCAHLSRSHLVIITLRLTLHAPRLRRSLLLPCAHVQHWRAL